MTVGPRGHAVLGSMSQVISGCCQADVTFLWLARLFVPGIKMNFAGLGHLFLDNGLLLSPEMIWDWLSWSVVRHEVRVFTPEGRFLVAALCFNGWLGLQPDVHGWMTGQEQEYAAVPWKGPQIWPRPLYSSKINHTFTAVLPVFLLVALLAYCMHHNINLLTSAKAFISLWLYYHILLLLNI